MNPELAEILGLLCAEGHYALSYSSYWGAERGKPRFYRNHKSERIEFFNKDKKLLMHYQKLVLAELGYAPNIIRHGKILICRRWIIHQLLRYTLIGHMKWSVPKEVTESEMSVKIAFLRGYFDGDGTASSRVRFFSTNKNGLIQVSGLLENIGIKHTLQKPVIKQNRKPIYTLQISEKEKETFLNLLKPISKRSGKCEGSHASTPA